MEGARAALVRIELLAVAEIAHIDHTTGEVEISRDRSTVPLGSATGVLTSADGIVATTWENLAVDNDAVAVYAANKLFADELDVTITGNGGDPAKEGTTSHPYWAPHLQHCYHHETHCIVFKVPQYLVRTYTSEPGGVMAELLNSPSEPQDVALLRISGGGAAPTAQLAAEDLGTGSDSVLLGFTKKPSLDAGPNEIPVTVDAETGRITSSEELAAPLKAGVSGGPVLDSATGQVLGLTGPRQPDGAVTLVPSSAIRKAMAEAKVEASTSKFDAVFRRGVDHLSSGNQGGAAESALKESLAYYDSALAANYLKEASAMGSEGTGDEAATDAVAETGGSASAVLLPILIGILLLAGILGTIVLRRRSRPAALAGAGPTPAGSSHPAPLRTVGAPSNRSAAGTEPRAPTTGRNDLSAGTTAATAARQQAGRAETGPTGHTQTGRGRTDSARTEAAEYLTPARRQPPATPKSVGQTPSTPNPGPGPDDDANTVGPLTPDTEDKKSPAFCSQCGRRVLLGARYCAGCGVRIG